MGKYSQSHGFGSDDMDTQERRKLLDTVHMEPVWLNRRTIFSFFTSTIKISIPTLDIEKWKERKTNVLRSRRLQKETSVKGWWFHNGWNTCSLQRSEFQISNCCFWKKSNWFYMTHVMEASYYREKVDPVGETWHVVSIIS